MMHVLSHASNRAKARIRKGLISIGLTLKLVSTVESAFKFAPLMEQFWRKRDKNFKKSNSSRVRCRNESIRLGTENPTARSLGSCSLMDKIEF